VKTYEVALKKKGQGMVICIDPLFWFAVVVIAAVTIMGPLVGKVFSTSTVLFSFTNTTS